MDYELEFNLDLDDILSEDSENVAELLDEDQLEKLGFNVCEEYDLDIESRSDWEGNIDKWIKLALQVPENKTYPWPNAANIKYPLLTTASLQFSSRAYPALIPSTNVVRGRVIGFDETGDKIERANRVSKHMSYQILEEMPDWEEQMDRLLFALPINYMLHFFRMRWRRTGRGKRFTEYSYS